MKHRAKQLSGGKPSGIKSSISKNQLRVEVSMSMLDAVRLMRHLDMATASDEATEKTLANLWESLDDLGIAVS